MQATATKANHLFKSNFGQCMCRWCGKRGGDCPVTKEMRRALKRFSLANGVRWKSRLREAWERGDDLGAELQQVRNIVGPSRLDGLTSRILDRIAVSEREELRRLVGRRVTARAIGASASFVDGKLTEVGTRFVIEHDDDPGFFSFAAEDVQEVVGLAIMIKPFV